MTLHPLTRELLSARFEYSPRRDEDIDNMVRGYLTGRSGWLKDKIGPTYGIFKEIDQAFQLVPEVCDKCGQEIKEMRRRSDER